MWWVRGAQQGTHSNVLQQDLGAAVQKQERQLQEQWRGTMQVSLKGQHIESMSLTLTFGCGSRTLGSRDESGATNIKVKSWSQGWRGVSHEGMFVWAWKGWHGVQWEHQWPLADD